MSKKTLVFSGTFLLCLFVNLVKHNLLFIGILNSLVPVLSIIFFEKHSRQKIKSHPIFLSLLAFIPLFSFQPQSIYLIILQLIFLAIFISTDKIPFLLISLLVLTVGLLISNKINSSNLIFNTTAYQESFTFFQKDAMYIPYKLRLLVYNQSVYIYSIFTNAFKLFSLNNLYDILLIANIYPFIYGLYLSFKSKNNWFLLLGLSIIFLIVGISKSPDKFNSLYFISPLFLYFILVGFKKINFKIYSLLLLISLFNL